MAFKAADVLSLQAFFLVLVSVVASFLLGLYSRWKVERGTQHAVKMTLLTILFLFIWLGSIALVVGSGWVEAAPMPRLFLLFGASNLAAIFLAVSPIGLRLSQLPLSALIGFQSFRFPLELILHTWAQDGVIPETMTWSGSNWDIISGIVAIVIAPFANRSPKLAWIANGIGFLLLINVARVAILSSPLPFAWQLSLTLQLGFHLPYALIIPVCVAGALAGHIVTARRLFLELWRKT